MSIVILILIGYISGICAGIFGIGGGVIIVPCLLFLGFDIQYAIGISIMQMIFSSLFGTALNLYNKSLIIRDGIFIGIGGLLGAGLSGVIVSTLSSQILLIAFLLLSCASFWKYAFRITTPTRTLEAQNPIYQKAILLITGVITGIFAVSLGVGGGLILAPILAHYLGFSSKKIVPISLFFIVFASISGGVSLAMHDLIDYPTGFIIGISSMFGVALGIYLMRKINQTYHYYGLLTIYLLSILMTIWKILEGFGIFA